MVFYVISVKPCKTVFFPEGGGQYADTGVLNDVNVTDVHEKEDIIYIPAGTVHAVTHGSLIYERNFLFMVLPVRMN